MMIAHDHLEPGGGGLVERLERLRPAIDRDRQARAALLQFDTFSGVLFVWLAFAAGQALEGMLVTPLLVGKRIGLHPVAVIFALLAFGQVFGFFGVLLALPASAALLVGIRHLGAAYIAGPLYGGAADASRGESEL